MTFAEAKELERLKRQEAANARLKRRDSKQEEIDRTISRRSGAWHLARTQLALSWIGDEVESRIAIRQEMIGRCPELASPYEAQQFEQQCGSFIEEIAQSILKNFTVMGVRPPATELSGLHTRKLSLKQRVQTALRMMQLETPKSSEVVPSSPKKANGALQSEYRFQIALSFPGEHRARVEHIAEILSTTLSRDAILYDRWHAAEFARPNLDVYLPDLYHEQSGLIVFFLCRAYAQKEWCGLEWRAGRDLLKHREDHRLMLLRLDDAEIPGLYSIDGYLDIIGMSDDDVAAAILNRLRSLPGRPTENIVSPPALTAAQEAPDPDQYWQQRKLLGDTAVFNKIKGQARWCIWIRPVVFKRARFQSMDQCERFMESLGNRFGPSRYPRFRAASLERDKEWIGCEVEENGNTYSHLERWVLFRSGQFVWNLALEHQTALGDRTHVLEVLDRATAAFEVAGFMAKEGFVSGSVRVTFDLFGVDGRRLTWPQDAIGDIDAVGPNCWSEDDRIQVTRTLSTDNLVARRRDVALDAAMDVYAAFRWSNASRAVVNAEQSRRFGHVVS
jgi:hypothetical protein